MIHKKKLNNKNSYWMYGIHPCKNALLNNTRKIDKILLDKKHNVEDFNFNKKIPLEIVDTKVIEAKVGKDALHQGIAILVHPLESYEINDFKNCNSSDQITLIALDELSDPHNVGAILRSAAVFGINGYITTIKNSASEAGVMSKSACGGIEKLKKYEVINLSKALNELKDYGFWIYGFSEHSNSVLPNVKFANRSVFVFGSEGDGMRTSIFKSCDETIKLPTSKDFSTLNVSNAASIALYEIFRQNYIK